MVWLHVIGMGDNGPDSLQPEALAALRQADLLVGGERNLELLPDLQAERLAWPKPFSRSMDFLRAHEDRQVAVIVTGDPLWYSAGARIARAFSREEVRFYPQVSAFQLACARLQWSLPDITCDTIHGRPVSQVEPLLGEGQKLLLLAWDHTTPKELGGFLAERGFGGSNLTALCHMGGADERRIEGKASDWNHEVEDFHLLAVELIADQPVPTLGRLPGLADERFRHDGQLTKRDIRALTLAKLRPMPGELLWDLGCGCGSVAIEWMRAAPNTRAIGVELNAERLAMARENMQRLGAEKLRLIEGDVTEIFDEEEAPHAIFFGGGTSFELIELGYIHLRSHGRLVCNAVTMETEQLLFRAHERWGGDLTRINLSELSKLGGYHGWRPAMPITQWSLTKNEGLTK